MNLAAQSNSHSAAICQLRRTLQALPSLASVSLHGSLGEFPSHVPHDGIVHHSLGSNVAGVGVKEVFTVTLSGTTLSFPHTSVLLLGRLDCLSSSSYHSAWAVNKVPSLASRPSHSSGPLAVAATLFLNLAFWKQSRMTFNVAFQDAESI